MLSEPTWENAAARWTLTSENPVIIGSGRNGHCTLPAVSARRNRRCLAVSGNEGTQVTTDTPDYTPTAVERSGPAIRAALLAHAPERCAQFEAEFRSALALAAENLDLSGPQAVLTH